MVETNKKKICIYICDSIFRHKRMVNKRISRHSNTLGQSIIFFFDGFYFNGKFMVRIYFDFITREIATDLIKSKNASRQFHIKQMLLTYSAMPLQNRFTGEIHARAYCHGEFSVIEEINGFCISRNKQINIHNFWNLMTFIC